MYSGCVDFGGLKNSSLQLNIQILTVLIMKVSALPLARRHVEMLYAECELQQGVLGENLLLSRLKSRY